MKRVFASSQVALALMVVAACGADVPEGLADKIGSGCADLIKPEPVAVITKGFDVAEIARGPVPDVCTVSVRGGGEVLNVGLIGYPRQDLAEQNVSMACQGGGWDASDKSCAVTSPAAEGSSCAV